MYIYICLILPVPVDAFLALVLTIVHLVSMVKTRISSGVFFAVFNVPFGLLFEIFSYYNLFV